MTSNLKVNTILASSGDTVSIAGIASITSSVSIASSCTAASFFGDGSALTGITAGLSNIVEDTSPQLGANLDTNSKCIDFGDSNTGTVNRLRFGASTDLEIFHNGTNNYIDCHTSGQDLYIRPTKDAYIQDYDTDDKHIKMVKDGAVELYHNGSKKFETTNTGAKVTGTLAGASEVGIQSGGVQIGAGITQLNFVGTGNTFAVNGTTVDISIQGGGGGTGAGGTWSSYTAGIATTKSVGVNTNNLDDNDLVGVGNSFQGLYISNGMMITDNTLSGNHYIGTAFNGLMAGPVNIEGTLTIDGNYVVV